MLTAPTKPFGLTLTAAQVAAFEQYVDLLLTWNQHINLTSITAPDDIRSKHLLDSLSVVVGLPDPSKPFSLIDVGSGAGFPGIPLKIALPDMALTLVESTGKKTDFLQAVVDGLQLRATTILTQRAEAVGRLPQQRQQYDVAVARAVAPLPTLVEYLLPLVKLGGVAIAQKGQDPTSELATARWAIGTLGGQAPKIIPVTVPNLVATRHLVVISKVKHTPRAYPRRVGLPKKEPLLPHK